MPLKAHTPNLLIIVDDSSFDLRINSGIASHTKLFKQILCFPSAEEALDFLSENLDNREVFPHLILLDIQMPSMNGFDFMKRYNKFPDSFMEQSDVIMLSSTDDLVDITKVDVDKNIKRLLKKPLQIEELKGAAQELYTID
ncbi:response regulator [Niabella insulamsoli]|uniref:response regulator n=1 Tax=Niabella insulamsoli TaxID=3144874 RepID=UPI0031FDB274